MATARKPANKARVEIPPSRRARAFEIDFNRVQEEIEEQLSDWVDNWPDEKWDESHFYEITLSPTYCIKEVTK